MNCKKPIPVGENRQDFTVGSERLDARGGNEFVVRCCGVDGYMCVLISDAKF